MATTPLEVSLENLGGKYRRMAGAVLAVLLAVAVAYFAAFEIRMITLPGAQEDREAAITLTTNLILEGGQPYTLATSPAVTNVYGIVYNYVVLPAAKLWGATFAVHRAASMVFLVAGAALLYWALRRMGTGRGLAFAGAAFYYLFNVCTYAIVARPDTLGDLIYLAVVFLVTPWPGQTFPSPSRLILSAALGVLAFYTKPYFLMSLGLATAVIFVTTDWKRALVYALFATALVLASIPLVNHFWSYYLFSIVTSHRYSEHDVPGFFWQQLKDFLELHAGVLLVAVFAGGFWLRRTNIASQQADKTLRAQGKLWLPEPWLLCLVLSFGVVALLLGRHVGAFRIYYIQLVTPFAIIVAVRAIAEARAGWQTLGLTALALNVALLLTLERPIWPQDSAPAWAAWNQFTTGHPWELLPPVLTRDVPVPGVPIIDDGQMTYFANIALDHLAKDDPAYVRTVDYVHRVQDLLYRRCFDIIVSSKDILASNEFELNIPAGLRETHYIKYTSPDFPVYYADYLEPAEYGSQTDQFIVWLRKPGPEHAELPLKPGEPPPITPDAPTL